MRKYLESRGINPTSGYKAIDAINKSQGKDNFVPTGLLKIYIPNGDGVPDGINSKVPLLKGYKGEGENAQKYEGRLDLDPESPTFGYLDTKFGFQNTLFPHKLFNNEFTSIGTYQGHENASEKDKNAFNKIVSHENFQNAVSLELLQLSIHANDKKLDNKEIIKKLRDSAPNGDGLNLADRYAKIVGLDIDPEKLFTDKNPGYVSEEALIAAGVEINNGEIFKIEVDENGETKKVDISRTGTGDEGVDIDYSGLANAFNDAPEQFRESFGVFGGGILSLKYPHDAVYGGGGVAGQDHIVIEQFQYKGSQAKSFTDEVKEASSYLGGLRRNSNIKEFIGVCRMPIPNNLSFSNGVSWGDGRINAVEAAAFISANKAFSTALKPGQGGILAGLGELKNDMGEFLQDISEGKLSGNQPGGALLSAFASQFALGRIGINVDANQFIQRGIGQAINPNLELLFNGPKLRSFGFSFNFAPNDELDASVMRKIQRFFKQGMSPKRSNENLIFLGSPNIFRLRYRTKQRDRIKGLPMHKICALTTCEINYAPDNVYQSYDDSKAGSSPIRTVMNLNFTELTPVFANDYLSDKNTLFEQSSNPGDPNFSQFNDEFGEDGGEGAFRPITTEDTGF